MTYMLLLNCALKLVEEINLYYDARSKKHQIAKEQFNFQETVFYTCSQRYEIVSRNGKNFSMLPSPHCYHQNPFTVGLSCKQHTA